MNVSYINPFIESVHEIFESMYRSEPVRGEIHAASGTLNNKSINAAIGLTGSISGTVALTLPVQTALVLVNRLLSLDIKEVDDTVLDGISELTNIVAGAAKARLPKEDDTPLKLGLPSVFKNEEKIEALPNAEKWVVIPFDSDYGAFALWVALEQN